ALGTRPSAGPILYAFASPAAFTPVRQRGKVRPVDCEEGPMKRPPLSPRAHNMRGLVLAAIATFATLQLAFGQVPEDRSDYELPGEGVFPEGIAYHEPSGSFFVSGA